MSRIVVKEIYEKLLSEMHPEIKEVERFPFVSGGLTRKSLNSFLNKENESASLKLISDAFEYARTQSKRNGIQHDDSEFIIKSFLGDTFIVHIRPETLDEFHDRLMNLATRKADKLRSYKQFNTNKRSAIKAKIAKLEAELETL